MNQTRSILTYSPQELGTGKLWFGDAQRQETGLRTDSGQCVIATVEVSLNDPSICAITKINKYSLPKDLDKELKIG